MLVVMVIAFVKSVVSSKFVIVPALSADHCSRGSEVCICFCLLVIELLIVLSNGNLD